LVAAVRGANFISACFLSHIGHSPDVIWLAALADEYAASYCSMRLLHSETRRWITGTANFA